MSEAAKGGGPDTEKPLATWTRASWPRRGRDTPPRTPALLPPLPAGRSRPLPSPVPPPPLPRSGQVLGGRTRGDRRTRDSWRPSRKSLPRVGLGVLPRRGVPAPGTASPSKEALHGAAPGQKRTCLWLLLGCLSSLGKVGALALAFENEGHDVRMEGQNRARRGGLGWDTDIRTDQP